MKSKILTPLALLCLITAISSAQEKMLTLEDITYQNRSIFPKSLNRLTWMGESDNFSYIEGNYLVMASAEKEGSDTVANLDDLNAGLADLKLDSIRRFPSTDYVDDYKFRFRHAGKALVYDIITRNLVVVGDLENMDEKAKNITVPEKSHWVAYTAGNNLFMIRGGKKRQITGDDNEGIVNGQTVHRVEFGIDRGIFWSPDANYIAFYRKDETMVTDYPLVDITPRIAEAGNTKYPMAGMASHHVTLGVYDIANDKTVFMKTGEPKDQYLTCVTWDPSEKYIYIALLNRDQNHLRLNKYDILTGEQVQTLFEEKDEQYVEPMHPLHFMESDPDRFLWFSKRSGYQHLYLYNTEGEMLNRITEGDWEVTGFLGFDGKEKNIFITGTKESPIEEHIYRVEFKSGKMTRISAEHGSHSGLVSASGDWIIDSYSSTETARAYTLTDRKGNKVRDLLATEDPLKDYKLGEMEIFTIEANDGADLYCRLIKPAGFDPSEKYPVFIYVYGGPHSQLVSDSWLGGARLFLHYMAQQGYVVFTMDNRGTAHRGVDFEQAIFRNLGTLEVEDQMKGVEYLRSLEYVDNERIGVDGWSYGGFMALSMALKNPGIFKAVCAGGPVIDWKYYEVMYGERYMDTPESNPEGYLNASLLNYIDNIEDNILIIHGTMDPTVVPQNSLSFLKACVDRGKQVEYFVYPGHPHNVRGKDRMHLYEKIRMFFDGKLKE